MEDQATEEEREAPLLLRNKPGRRAVSSDIIRPAGWPVSGLLRKRGSEPVLVPELDQEVRLE